MRGTPSVADFGHEAVCQLALNTEVVLINVRGLEVDVNKVIGRPETREESRREKVNIRGRWYYRRERIDGAAGLVRVRQYGACRVRGQRRDHAGVKEEVGAAREGRLVGRPIRHPAIQSVVEHTETAA